MHKFRGVAKIHTASSDTIFVQIYMDLPQGVPGVSKNQSPPPPEFGRRFNPIETRGADYGPRTVASPPGFKMLSTPLKLVTELRTSTIL